MKQENLEIITKHYYMGLTSRVEEKALFEEIEDNPESFKFFKDYESEYVKHHFNSSTIEKQWNRFYSNRLDPVRVRRRKLLNSVLRYAAVVLLAIGLTTGFSLIHEWMKGYSSVEWYETYVPRGEKTILTLPDGTKVWLNAETTLKYPATPLKDKRIMHLSGEGFFKVAKNKDVPFVVQTDNYDVVVTGTSFNIMAYDDCDRVETTLISGEVEIKNIKGYSSYRTMKIEPGQKIIFNKKGGNLSIIGANVVRESAWKDNLFMFKDIKFEELCQRLERWYDVDVALADPELKEIKYTGNFRNEETIWQVLDIIKVTTPISYDLENRKLTIYKE